MLVRCGAATISVVSQRAQTIVRLVSGSAAAERFCVLHETPLPAAHGFLFACAGSPCSPHGVTMAAACDLLIAAGIPEPDGFRLLGEARAGLRPFDAAQA